MSKVYFEEDHWKNPRRTIANIYENNDYGYVFHATSILIDVLEFANLSVLDCKNLRVLDYGCGTGRVARQFALTGAHVEGFDPVKECIIESEVEFEKLGDRYKKPRLLTHEFEKVKNKFDLVYCVNVVEHLNDEATTVAINNIEQSINETGQIILWVHTTKNKTFCEQQNLNDLSPGIIVVKGIKAAGVVTYSPVFRK